MKGKCIKSLGVKGYLFLQADGDDTHIFCHHTEIQKPGFRDLAEGERVEFDVVEGAKGKQAVNVRSCEARP